MTAREKIQGLTHAWYGFALFTALLSILQHGIGIFSLVGTAVGTAFCIFVAWFLGGRLLARSELTRLVLIVLAALCGVAGAYAAWELGFTFFRVWRWDTLMAVLMIAGGVYMNVRSLRVLTDRSVRGYCAR